MQTDSGFGSPAIVDFCNSLLFRQNPGSKLVECRCDSVSDRDPGEQKSSQRVGMNHGGDRQNTGIGGGAVDAR
jgi:hypothetical protein